MSGFVDVSNMSDLEIKRLSQIDEVGDAWSNPYAYRNLARRNPYAYRKSTVKQPSFSYDADLVWTASVVAFRTNGAYIKALAPRVDSPKTNRQLMEQMLKDNVQFSESDIAEGRKMRQYFQGLTFKMIEGKTLNDFLQNALKVSQKDTIENTYDISVIACLPSTFEKMVVRDDVDRRIKWANGGTCGNVGDKVKAKIEVLKCVWSQNWNTFYVTGITDDDKVLFFSYKSQLKIGDCVTIQGNVKTYRDKSTQLNRVKVIQ